MRQHIEAPFTVQTWDMTADPSPTQEGAAETGRAVLAKTYAGGDLVATATGQALTARGPGGASYVAQERVVGTLCGLAGSFVLEHGASMGEGVETAMHAAIVPGSGTGALAGVRGSGQLAHELLTLDVELPQSDGDSTGSGA